MDDLNYHHLRYFWTVARTGSISKASAQLGLTQPTISEQLRMLENAFGHKLFDRVGRSLVLTEKGRVAFGYAERIFVLGEELTSAVSREEIIVASLLRIGVDPAVDSDLVAWLLRPLAKEKKKTRIFLERRPIASAFPALSDGKIDLLLGMDPGATKSFPSVFRHLLCECGTTFLAADAFPSAKFPKCLASSGLLAPAEPLRSELEKWLRAKRIHLVPTGEASDSDMARQLAALGLGAVAVPDLPGRKPSATLQVLGRTDSVRSRLYGFTRERRPNNPALMSLFSSAQKRAR